jgi:hypothetical protein
MHSSQIELPSQEQGNRVQSAVSFPRPYRTNHTMSTHSPHPTKIFPRNISRKPQGKRSESTHLNKTNDRSLIRYKKLDMTVG